SRWDAGAGSDWRPKNSPPQYAGPIRLRQGLGQSKNVVMVRAIRAMGAETLKYSTKPADMVADPEWFLELTRQTHKRRFVATGGALKDV
ncbi:protein rep, partial [Salmonella enterica subsp. enterica serovar Kentucky]|nr:protein rep [Salmonella enterica subsp. enterica serovar Kentucky]